MYYTSYIFHLLRKTACITLLEVLLCNVFRADSLLDLFFFLHAKVSVVLWTGQKFTGLKCLGEIYIGHFSLSSK